MCRSLESCKWGNACNPCSPSASSPPSLSHLTASAHILSSKDAGGKKKKSAPSPQDSPDGAWATSAAREKRRLPHLQGPFPGAPLCVFNTPICGEREPSLHAHDCRGFEGRTAEYLPAGATTRDVERRVGAGWGQGKIGTRPPRLRAVARIRAMVEVWRPVRLAQLGPRGSGRLARSGFSTLDSARAATAL